MYSLVAPFLAYGSEAFAQIARGVLVSVSA